LRWQQTNRQISYGGREYVIYEVPMLGLWHYGDDPLPKRKSKPPAFDVTSSAKWTGYSAIWEIRNKKLLLRSLQGRIDSKVVHLRRGVGSHDKRAAARIYKTAIMASPNISL
jgi:hypothetical protein